MWEFVYQDKPRCWVHYTLSVIRKVKRCTAWLVPSTIINIVIASSVNNSHYCYDIIYFFIILNYAIVENITFLRALQLYVLGSTNYRTTPHCSICHATHVPTCKWTLELIGKGNSTWPVRVRAKSFSSLSVTARYVDSNVLR